jgi:phosphopantetheinyl transferase
MNRFSGKSSVISQTANNYLKRFSFFNGIQDVSDTWPFSPDKDNVSFVPYHDLHIPIAYSCMNVRKRDKRILLDRLISALNKSDGLMAPCSNPFSYTMQNDTLGKPLLYFGNTEGPTVSFSHSPGQTWASMSMVKGLGIDAELPETFNGPYPFQRVFGKDEFDHATKLCFGRLDKASALLWSAKEAAVKAMGCGFHFFGPLEIKVREIKPSSEGFSGTLGAETKIPFSAVRKGPAWISIAWID